MTDRLTKIRISYPLHYRLLLTCLVASLFKKKKRFIKTGADCCRSNKHSVTRQPPVHKPLLVKAPKPKTQAVITSPHPPSLTMLSQLQGNSFLCCAMRCLGETYCLKYSVKTTYILFIVFNFSNTSPLLIPKNRWKWESKMDDCRKKSCTDNL